MRRTSPPGTNAVSEHHLGDAFAVAQIDENAPAEVSAVRDPTVEDDLGADVFCPKIAAVVGSSDVVDKAGHKSSLGRPFQCLAGARF